MNTSLLNGCALVIDDELSDAKSSISKMIATLEKEGTLFIKCEDLPAYNTRNNLSGISFIVLDWDIKNKAEVELPDNVRVGAALGNIKSEDNISFIKDMLKRYFLPIFIFSQQDKTSIIAKLEADTEIVQALEKRVFVENKRELTGARVKSYLEKWLKKNRTVFALKMFEEQLNQSKNTFLVEVGDLNSEWANLVYNTIKKDHVGDDEKPIPYSLNSEFGEFLTNSLLGRMGYIDFDNVKFLSRTQKVPKVDVDKIYESIKFYKYGIDVDNGQAYEGDIYQKYEGNQPKNDYLININAPCDIRKKKILFVQGRAKEKFRASGVAFYSLPSFAKKASIEFRYDDRYRIDKPDNLSEISIDGRNYKRIGRIIHPYITAIRNEFAHFISRQGIPRHPE